MKKKKHFILAIPATEPEIKFFRKFYGEPVVFNNRILNAMLFTETKTNTFNIPFSEESNEQMLKVSIPQHYARLINIIDIKIKMRKVFAAHFDFFITAQTALGISHQAAAINFFELLEVQPSEQMDSQLRSFRRFKKRITA